MGMKTIDRNPKMELAQPIPSFLYIAEANEGKPAPNADLIRSFPAKTDAAYSGYASGRYVRTELKRRNVPIEKNPLPI
jgi:hypothetical protein